MSQVSHEIQNFFRCIIKLSEEIDTETLTQLLLQTHEPFLFMKKTFVVSKVVLEYCESALLSSKLILIILTTCWIFQQIKFEKFKLILKITRKNL